MILAIDMIIKRVGPLSCAKIAGTIYATLGLFIGALISLFALIGTAVYGSQSGLAQTGISPILGGVIGVGAIVLCPVFYGAIGFVFTLIGAWFYNVVASKVGGIEIEIADSTPVVIPSSSTHV